MYQYLILLVCLSLAIAEPIRGTKCAKNQVITRLTVYEDGALEAECGAIPCGLSGMRCIEDQVSCRADTDVFSGMRWAANGQSVLLRCCTLKIANKIYVGTDLVSSGSYYVGGPVAEKDLYGQAGTEFDFIANVRTEQGGVRVWVYRIMCGTEESTGEESSATTERVQTDDRTSTFDKRREYLMNRLGAKNAPVVSAAESNDEETETVSVDMDAGPFNPLRYRPPSKH